MAFDKSQLDAIQAYYLTHKEEIYTRTFENPLNDSFFQIQAKDKVILPNGATTEMLQPYQAGHHSKGNVTLGGRLLDGKLVKADQTIDSRVLDADYYYSFMNASGNNPKQFPYQAWVAQMIMNQIYEDYELTAKWNGQEVAVTPGTPGPAASVMNGLETLIQTEVTATNITPIATGAIGSTTAYAQVSDFVKSALDTPGKRARRFNLYTSLDVLDKVRDDYETKKGGGRFSKDPETMIILPGTNTMMIAQAGISGDKLRLTKPNNFNLLFDGAPSLNLDYRSRQIFVEVDWKIGAQFASTEELYVNDI